MQLSGESRIISNERNYSVLNKRAAKGMIKNNSNKKRNKILKRERERERKKERKKNDILFVNDILLENVI